MERIITSMIPVGVPTAFGPGYKLRPNACALGLARAPSPRGGGGNCERVLRIPTKPAAQPPARAAEGKVRHRREARLMLAQRQQQMRNAIARGQALVGHLHAITVHSPRAGADEHSARFPEDPYAQPAALDYQPGLLVYGAGTVIQ